MNKREAQQLLAEFVAGLKSRTYQEWQDLIGEEVVVEKIGPSGVTYQIEFEAFWDSPKIKAGGAIRVMVSIDDGSLARFIVPLTTSFLISPEGKSCRLCIGRQKRATQRVAPNLYGLGGGFGGRARDEIPGPLPKVLFSFALLRRRSARPRPRPPGWCRLP